MIPISDLWMLGLRPEPRSRATEETPVAGAPSCKYIVGMRFGRWRVLRDGLDAEAFPDQDAAIRFACDRAREQAATGVAGVVVVQGDIHELHCFTPPQAEIASPLRSPRLRVVAPRGDGPATV